MKRIYAVRDRIANDLAGIFPLVVMRTDQQAVRYFGDSLLTEQKSALSAHPDDYELVYVGELADDGTIVPQQLPQIIITGTALMGIIENKKQDTLKLQA